VQAEPARYPERQGASKDAAQGFRRPDLATPQKVGRHAPGCAGPPGELPGSMKVSASSGVSRMKAATSLLPQEQTRGRAPIL